MSQSPEKPSPSIARRRALFKGLLGGAAAAGVPLKAHANYSGKFCDKQGGKGRKADASSHASVVSLAPDNNNECKGYSCAHYGATGGADWANFSCNGHGYTCTYGAISKGMQFYKVFNLPSGSGKQLKTLLQLCNDPTDSDEKTYACAFANANKLYQSASPQFPYTPAGVVALYNSSVPNVRTQGAQLFSLYLSTMA